MTQPALTQEAPAAEAFDTPALDWPFGVEAANDALPQQIPDWETDDEIEMLYLMCQRITPPEPEPGRFAREAATFAVGGLALACVLALIVI